MPHYNKELPTNYVKAFKDADIRGVYPTEIDETVAYRVAQAFVKEFCWSAVLVARDMRESSPALAKAFIDGVRDSGALAIDIGVIDTPGLYYVSGSRQSPGVVITGSHNTAEYNGLKLVAPGAIPLTGKTGLSTIKKRIQTNDFKTVKKRGALKKQSILREYTSYIKQTTTIESERPLRVVVDAGNGTASIIMQKLAAVLPIEITPLFYELDGTFPNRESNPTLAKNQKAIKAELKKGGYDFGIAFDGDADRVAFFDEQGKYINSSFVGALIADHLLKEFPKSAHVYTVFTSRAYKEAITAAGGKAVRARVGHAFIKEVMRKKDAVFGCEHSAHFYFKDNYYTDSGALAFLFVAAALAKQIGAGGTFSQLLKPYATYFQTEEVLVKVHDKAAVLAELARQYKAEQPISIETFDGLSVQFTDHWLVIKKSVTEDALKYVVEGPKKTVVLARQKQIKHALNDINK